MAATATVTKKYGIGGTATLYVGTIAFDSSYPTGGEAIDVSGNERLEVVLAQHASYTFEWDQNDQKLKVGWGDYSAAADGAHVEVANTTDISALTAVPFVAIGS